MQSIFILGCLIQFALSGQQKSLHTLKITNLDCYGNSDWFTDVECSLKPLKNRSIQLQGSTFIKRPVYSAKVRIQIFRWHSGFRPYLVDFWFDYCDIQLHPQKINALLMPFYTLISKYSNLDHPCPVQGLVEVPPTVPDLSVFPSMLVTGTYLLNFTVMEKKLDKWLFTFKIKGDVTSDLRE